MSFTKLGRFLVLGVIVCLVLGAAGLGFLRWRIQVGLDRRCEAAQEAHPFPGDDVAAMITFVQSESHSLADRNHAVWALGQAGDERALPVLRSLITGEDCDHDKELCQYELRQALETLTGTPDNILGIRTPAASDH